MKSAEREVADLFQAFYTQFILRDLLAKVAPGAILLAGGSLALVPLTVTVEYAGKASLGAWVLGGAVAWLLGLSLQGVGEVLHFVRYHPRSVTETEWQGKLAKFHATAKPPQAQHYERFVVIKEASGNAAVAIVAAAALVSAMCWGTTAGYLALATLATIPGLAKIHWANADRGFGYINAVLAEATPDAA